MQTEPIHTQNLELLGSLARCPVCGEPPKGDVWVCPACSALHHAECRDYVGGCSTYACVNARPVPAALEGKKMPLAPVASGLALRLAAVALACLTFSLVSRLLTDASAERAEAEALRREAARSAASLRVDSGELSDLLGNVKVTIDLSGDSGTVSAKIGDDTALHVGTAKVIVVGP